MNQYVLHKTEESDVTDETGIDSHPPINLPGHSSDCIRRLVKNVLRSTYIIDIVYNLELSIILPDIHCF